MRVEDRIVVVTGAASGIGRALALRFAAEGARLVVCSDLNFDGAKAVADTVGGLAVETNVGREADIKALIEDIETQQGPIDLFCSNAGIAIAGGVGVEDAAWTRMWDINLMAHVWAARHLVPRMAARGGGYLLNTASAAGLLTELDSLPYSVTKHAAVGLAEWLAIKHADEGIRVSVLCPQGVKTAMTAHGEGANAVDGMIDPEDVAEACVRAIEAEEFLVLPHPMVLEYMRRKTGDYDRWLRGMQKLNRRLMS
jgi:NAD(P)-dependent dehydrogenase (short-subunit alcohol dehydrogenase family)